MVGILVSSRDDPFSGAMLVSGRVIWGEFQVVRFVVVSGFQQNFPWSHVAFLAELEASSVSIGESWMPFFKKPISGTVDDPKSG